MLRSFLDKKYSLFWIGFHVILGVGATLNRLPVLVWFYFIFLLLIYRLIMNNGKVLNWLLFILIYLTSFEVLSRMAGCSPFIPYELGKYIVFATCMIGIIFGFRSGTPGWFMLVMLFPSLLIDESGMVTIKDIVFNLLGPINVALAIIFLKKRELAKEDFISFMRLLLFPAISVLTYVFIKTPKLDTIEFSLGSNFATSGGFGANQISTILGLGAFLTFLSWKKNWCLSGYRWLDLLLFITFAFRGLLTFSRGGMLGGFLGILILLAFETPKGYPNKFSGNVIRLFKVIPVILVLIITFRVADNITGGMLTLRYKGETKNTLSGRKEKDINTLTANRYEIFSEDVDLWLMHPILGVGVGASSELRSQTRGFAAHVELSRLISEHGILGIIYFIILIYLGFKIFLRARHDELSAVQLAFYTIALFTTFHAATRTYISPLLIGISMLTILPDEEEHEDEEPPQPDSVQAQIINETTIKKI
jgi:TRAP-type C4-dicarboxylate transport system permease small subunit